MSIKAMTWAFGLPLEARAKIALLAIADNARDDGVAWPSRDTIADKSSQSRATINRRLKMLVDLGVLALHERFREDGSQTTDEIRLDLTMSAEEVMRRVQGLSAAERGETGDEGGSAEAETEAGAGEEGGCQADTPPVQSGHPGAAVVTGGGLQSGHPQDEPSLEPKNPPNPPDGGPLSKSDREAAERRDALWQRFLAEYPRIAMDQQAARLEFDQLTLEEAEWAASVVPTLKEDLRKANNRAPQNAHLWLRKRKFLNFPKVSLATAPPAEGVWIVEGSDEDRALSFVRHLARGISPRVVQRLEGDRGYLHKTAVGPDLLAMLAVVNDVPLRWPTVARGSREFGAWQARFVDWVQRGLPCDPGTELIHVPWPWPPKKDGTPYDKDDSGANDSNDDDSDNSDNSEGSAS